MSKQLLEIDEITPNYLIRSFLLGIDDQAFLELNNNVFTDHPDQGGWSKTDFEVRVNEEWFDEKGFFVCEDKGKLIGFCWTKIHGAHIHSHEGNEPDHGHEAIGEIYVLAVDPAYRGKGIGKDLTITGLNYLKYRGLSSAMLYVGVENKLALDLYKSLGFTHHSSDIIYKSTKNIGE
jgi:mycothiol synthase